MILRRLTSRLPLSSSIPSLKIANSVFSKRLSSTKTKFPTLDGRVDKTSAKFMASKEKGTELEKVYKELTTAALAGGGENARKRHTIRNKKLLVRDRISKLLDKGSDFLELSTLAGLDLEYGTVPCAGVVSGIGKVSGKLCMVLANDATVKAGTVYPIGVKKQLRAQEIAEANRLPFIFLVDSGGAFLPLQAEIFPETGGRTFYNEAIMSSKGIPVVCVVCGSCTAGAAYIPTMAEEAVIIDKIGTIFLAGPPLVKAATGEVVTAEELGGAMLHSSISGCTDHFAIDEEKSLETTRQVIASLNIEDVVPSSSVVIEPPLFSSDDLLTLSTFDSQELPIYEIISRIVDGSRLQEFKIIFGPQLICGFAHIHGYMVGILANNGPITSQAALKGAHFVELCCQRDIPLVFLQNTVSQHQGASSDGAEMGALIKDQAKMMHAVACAEVPKFTVILGGSYGPQSSAMCGRSFDPRFLYTWPSAKVAMDTTDNLTELIMMEDGNDTSTAENDEDKKKKWSEKYKVESSACYGTARLWDDGMILPQDTRKVLGMSLRAALSYSEKVQQSFGVFRM